MKKRTRTSRRIRIAVLWLVFLVIVYFLISHFEKSREISQAKSDLLTQAEIVSEYIPSVVENDLCAHIGKAHDQEKLQALAYFLEKTDSVEEAKRILNGYAEATDLTGVALYDRDGILLHVTQGAEAPQLDIGQAWADAKNLSSAAQSAAGKSFSYYDTDLDQFFSYRAKLEDQQQIALAAVGDRWLLAEQFIPSVSQMIVEYSFEWTNALKQTTIGENGFILAVREAENMVMSFREDERLEGEPIESLSILLPGQRQPASGEELREAFRDAQYTAEIQVAGRKYLAARLDVPNVLMLALRPMEEIQRAITSDTGRLFLLMTVVSGLYALYAFFHTEAGADQPAGEEQENKKSLASNLKVLGVLALLFIFAFGIFLKSLSSFNDTIQITRVKAESAVLQLEDNEDEVDELASWIREESISKCNAARYLIENTPPETLTREYMAALAECLGIKYLYLINASGEVAVTNTENDLLTIREDSVFWPLLQGKAYLAEKSGEDGFFNESLQEVGIALRYGPGHEKGIVLIMADTARQDTIRNNLAFSGIFRRVSMTDGAVMLAVDGVSQNVIHLSEVSGGDYRIGLEGYDYTESNISELGISADSLRDEYEGNLTVLDVPFFASMQRDMDGSYVIALQAQTQIGTEQVVPAAGCAAVMLIFVLLLIPIACAEGGTEPEGGGEARRHTGMHSKMTRRLEKNSEILLSIFGGLTDTAKPFFKDRWPRDTVEWKDKTPDMKFMAVTKQTLIVVFVYLFITAMINKERSVWYYCLNGQWDPGFNLHFFAASIVSVGALLIFRIMLHKLLFLIARVVNTKGETICHLLDSMAGYILATVGVFVCLKHFGVDTTVLSLTGGIAGVVFGIGAQNVVNDILSGILMTFEGIIRVGDLIFYEENIYIVLSVGLRTTQLIWFGEITVIRNNDLKNYKRRPTNHQNRVAAFLRVDLNESIERVEEILRRELPQIREKLRAIDPDVEEPRYEGVERIEENWVSLFISCLCTSQYNKMIDRALQRELKLMCERNGIHIPVRQVAVNAQSKKCD